LQLADDAEFTKNVRTIFNNDQDDSSKLGAGTDREFFEPTRQLINAKGPRSSVCAVLLQGSTESALNEYTEIEVYGRPASDHQICDAL